MKTLISCTLLAALATVSVSCKKNDSVTPEPTKVEQLTAKKWRVSAATSSTTYNGSTTTHDEYASSPDCERDNFAQFNTNKTVVFDEGATKCNSSDPQTQNGTWDFNSDQTKLNLTSPDLGGLVIPFDVVTLNATTLTIRFTQTSSGVTSTITETFTSF